MMCDLVQKRFDVEAWLTDVERLQSLRQLTGLHVGEFMQFDGLGKYTFALEINGHSVRERELEIIDRSSRACRLRDEAPMWLRHFRPRT